MTILKKSLMMAVLLLLSGVAAHAVPAYPAKRVITKKDGTKMTLTLRGDEHCSFFTDDEGQAYQLIDGDYTPVNMDDIKTIWTSRMNKANQARARRHSVARVGKPVPNLIGTKKGLVILIQFQDVKFSFDNANAIYNDFFNKEGYTDYGMAGSVKDYFKAQSYGQFELDFDVAGPYTAAQKLAYYGKTGKNFPDENPAELIQEACLMADQDVNFANYDWDGDGEVDQVFVIYAGYSEAEGAASDCIWPHESHLKMWGINLKLDNTDIDTYACGNELRGSGKSEEKILGGIGTACHEFSHCLGLPDFYNTTDQMASYGMGNWDVMDGGVYNNNSCTPAGYTSYERMFAGWLQPTEINTMTRIQGMKPLTEAKEAYILYNENNKDEYYLLENRQPVGFDAGLGGHGLLVLHVDYNESIWFVNGVNAAAAHQRMTIMPADGKCDYYSEAGDPFPGKSGVTELTNYSTPAATLYNENTDGRKLMSKSLDNITESEDGLISFVACRPELGIPEPGEGTAKEGENAFTVTWPAITGAVSYELELTEMPKATDNPQEALQGAFNFDKCVSKSVGFTDISSKMGEYGLSGWSGNKLFTSPNKLLMGTSSAAGYIKTPTWSVPSSMEFTIVMGAQLFKEGTPVKGTLKMAIGNSGDPVSYEEIPFELTESGMMVFNFSTRKELFFFEIRPETRMYLNYLAIYDGTWSAEQLGLANQSARQMTPKKAVTITNYTTDTNSYTFKDLNSKNRFYYRVRALGEENTRSQWSEEHQFTFATGIIDRQQETTAKDNKIYDVRGVYKGTNKDMLEKGIYIIGGKKVVK